MQWLRAYGCVTPDCSEVSGSIPTPPLSFACLHQTQLIGLSSDSDRTLIGLSSDSDRTLSSDSDRTELGLSSD